MVVGELIHAVHDKVWFQCPVTILETTEQYLAFQIKAGTIVLRAADKAGNILKLGEQEWILKETLWRKNNLTYIVPFEGYIGYGILTDEKGSFVSYYLNFQDKLSLEGHKIKTLDFELDFVITDYEKKIYYWKDIKEFELLKSKHFFEPGVMENIQYDSEKMFFLLEKYKDKLDFYTQVN